MSVYTLFLIAAFMLANSILIFVKKFRGSFALATLFIFNILVLLLSLLLGSAVCGHRIGCDFNLSEQSLLIFLQVLLIPTALIALVVSANQLLGKNNNKKISIGSKVFLSSMLTLSTCNIVLHISLLLGIIKSVI